MPDPGQLVLLVSPKGKRYLRVFDPGKRIHTNDGFIDMAEVADVPYGSRVKTHMGHGYRLLRPTIYDLVKGLKRQTQIIYPKDIGYILLKLGIGPGARVIEAGSGSGSLTTALAFYVGAQGKVYTYERRPEFKELCGKNLAWAGLADGRVEQFSHDISEGFLQSGVDALFLDVRTPWEHLDAAAAAVAPGAPLGFLLPTVNQVSNLLAGLEKGPFAGIEVVEILLRHYKPVPDRLRPEDRMVAHTGFLVFCRQQEGGEPPVGRRGRHGRIPEPDETEAAGAIPDEDEGAIEDLE